MRVLRRLCLLAVIVALAVPTGCMNYVGKAVVHVVYIDDTNCKVVDYDGNPIEALWVFPGDEVVWVNTTASSSITVKIEDGFTNDFTTSSSGLDQFTIDPGKRHRTKILQSATGEFDYTLGRACAPGSDGPKVSVGDPP